MHGKQCKTISTKLKLVMEKWNEKHEFNLKKKKKSAWICTLFSVHVILLPDLLLIWSGKVISQTGKD